MKKLVKILSIDKGHWVGDGFPVRTLFSYDAPILENSPFLLLDFAGPFLFPPANAPRGVGLHPHRGFETVSLVYSGELVHKDSSGGSGKIGPDEVQWMTAASGVIHEEFHSDAFTQAGGVFFAIQLWVNLPAKDKMSLPKYQYLSKARIPEIALPHGAGSLRLIAGQAYGAEGGASTHTPINMWDVSLKPGAQITLPVPQGHMAFIVGVEGEARLEDEINPGGDARLYQAAVGVYGEGEDNIELRAADEGARLLVLSGAPIVEPVVGRGPFVMNTEAEIKQAYADYRNGSFGQENQIIQEIR